MGLSDPLLASAALEKSTTTYTYRVPSSLARVYNERENGKKIDPIRQQDNVMLFCVHAKKYKTTSVCCRLSPGRDINY